MSDSIFSEPFYADIPMLRMAKARIISRNPEAEVIKFLETWLQERGIDITQSRRFGFDVPVSKPEKEQGIRGYEYWMQVPDSIQASEPVNIEQFPGGNFIALRITEPFLEPFERIPLGWQTLVKYIGDHGTDVEWCTPGCCLEEVKSIDGITYMDVYIRLK